MASQIFFNYNDNRNIYGYICGYKYVSFLSTKFVSDILRPDTYLMSYVRYAGSNECGSPCAVSPTICV